MKVSHYGFLIGKTAFSQRKIIEIKAKLIYNKAMWNNFNKKQFIKGIAILKELLSKPYYIF